MQIQINTANNVPGREAVIDRVGESVRDRLSRFQDRLTRVEVHLGDEDGPGASDNDKRCVIEARPTGIDPVTVTGLGDSIDQATSGALAKMTVALERTFGKLSDRKGH